MVPKMIYLFIFLLLGMISSPIATYPVTEEERSAILFLQEHGFGYSQFRDYDKIVTINRYPHHAGIESDGFKSFAEYGHEIDEYERIKDEQEKLSGILSIAKESTGNGPKIKDNLDVLIKHLKIRMDASGKAQASSIKSIEDKLKRANPKIKQKQIGLVLRDNSKTMREKLPAPAKPTIRMAAKPPQQGHPAGLEGRGPNIRIMKGTVYESLRPAEPRRLAIDKAIEEMRLAYAPGIPARAFSTNEVSYPFSSREEGIAVLDEHLQAIDQNERWLDELYNKCEEMPRGPIKRDFEELIKKLLQQDALRREAQKRSQFNFKMEFPEGLKPQPKAKKTIRWADEHGQPLTHHQEIPSRYQEAAARRIDSAYEKHLAHKKALQSLHVAADVVDDTDSRTGVRGQGVPSMTRSFAPRPPTTPYPQAPALPPPPPAHVRRTSPRTPAKHGELIRDKELKTRNAELKARNKERSAQTPGIVTENPALLALKHRPERQTHDVVDSTDWQTGVSGRGIPAITMRPPTPPSVRRPAPSKIGRFDDKDGLRDRTTRHSIDRVDKNNGMRFLKPLEENALLTQPLSPSVRKPEYSRTTPRPMPAPVIRNKPRQPSSMKHMKNDERDGKIYQMSRNPLFYHTPSIVTDNPLAAALKRRQERTPVDVIDTDENRTGIRGQGVPRPAPSTLLKPTPPLGRRPVAPAKSSEGAASGTSEGVVYTDENKTGIHGRSAHTPSPVRSRRMDGDRAAIARRNALVKALAHQPATARARPSGDISPASASNSRPADENPALRMMHNPMRARRDMPPADANPEIPTKSRVSAIASRFGGSKEESAPAKPEAVVIPSPLAKTDRLEEARIAAMRHFKSPGAQGSPSRTTAPQTRVRARYS